MKPYLVTFTAFVILLIGFALGYGLRPRDQKPDNQAPPPQEITLKGLSHVTGQKFPLATVIEKNCDVQILEPSEKNAALMEFITVASQKVATDMSQANSPARQKKRINEVSALFEDALRFELDSHPDFSCDYPKTRDGKTQRSGYPDLRVQHHPTETIAYLDPKLFSASSIKSSFRTFYYEPSLEHAKVTENALHLLVGFPHDDKTHQWTFFTPKLVDLSDLQVTLKTEFSASNRDLYSE